MRSSKLLMILFVVGVSVLLTSMPASAGVVNMTTGQTLFYDDFEGLGTNVSHLGGPDEAGDFDPTGGNPGSWNIAETWPVMNQVTDAVGSVTGQIAAQGHNYMRMWNQGATRECTMLFANQSTLGDHIHFEQMFYVDELTQTNPIQLIGDQGNTFNIMTSYNPGGGTIGSYTGVWPPTTVEGLNYAAGQWQKWELDYNIGDTTLTLAIDGVSVSGIPCKSSNLSRILLVTDSHIYFDEIGVPAPEPSALAMLVATFVGLLAYAWRKRK